MTDRTRLLSTTSTNTDNNLAVDNGGISTQTYGTISQPEEMDDDKTTLKFIEKIGFSLGHVFNDLAAGIWFSYTLLFFQGVLNMTGVQGMSYQSGAMVMMGQVGDAIATPLVGFISDKFLTKRKFHVLGTIIVFMTFPLIFATCPFCDIFPHWWKILYFTIVILAFQFGWPMVQITHLAMIPELSRTQRDRSDLTATRYSASIASNVICYIVTWGVLHLQPSYNSKITPSSGSKFRDIALILTLIGGKYRLLFSSATFSLFFLVSMTVLFHFSLSLSGYEYRRRIAALHRGQALPSNETENLIRNHAVEEPSTSSQSVDSVEDANVKFLQKKNFFKSPLLYQNALLYVFSRLFMTTSLVYMPLWLNERAFIPTPPSENLEPSESNGIENIATIPLASFIASFIASNIFKQTNRFIGHKIGYLIGSFISFAGCFWVAFAASPNSSTFELYIVAILFGAGSSITMIASLCITADMIGNHCDSGGVIYSAVTFCDKLITGLVIVVIESIKCQSIEECPTYYRNVLSIACGIPAILGKITLLTLVCTKSWTDRIEREEQRRLRRI